MAVGEKSPVPLDYARPMRFGDGPIARLQDWFSIPLMLSTAIQALACSQKLGVDSLLGIGTDDLVIAAMMLAVIISMMTRPVIDSRFGYRVFPETVAKMRAVLAGAICPSVPLLIFSFLWRHPIDDSLEVELLALSVYVVVYPLLAATWIVPNNRVRRG